MKEFLLIDTEADLSLKSWTWS